MSQELNAAQLQSRAFSGVTWTVINVLVSLPVGFGVNILLARVLGVTGFGQLAYLTAALDFMTRLVDVGTSTALIQFGSKAHASGDHVAVQRLLSRTQGFRLLVAAPALSVFVVVILNTSVALVVATVVFGVWLPAALSGVNDSLVLENRTAVGAKIAIVSSVFTQAVVVGVALSFRHAESVWVARLLMTNVGIAVALLVVTKQYRRAVLRPLLPRGMPAGFWRFALPTAAAGLVGMLAISRSEVFVLQWLSTPHAVGVYALAFGLATHIFAPAAALTNPLIPAISGLTAVEPDKLRAAFLRVVRVSSLATAGALVLITPAVATLLPTIYGADFAEARLLLLALAVSGGLTTFTGPVFAFVVAQRASRRMLWANLVALGVDAAASFGLVPVLGAWGAVVASGSCAVVLVVLFLQIVNSRLRARRAQLVRGLAPLVLGGACSTGAWWLGEAVTGYRVASAAIALVVAVIALVIVLRLARLGITDPDRQAISRNVPARLRVPATRLLALVTVRAA